MDNAQTMIQSHLARIALDEDASEIRHSTRRWRLLIGETTAAAAADVDDVVTARQTIYSEA